MKIPPLKKELRIIALSCIYVFLAQAYANDAGAETNVPENATRTNAIYRRLQQVTGKNRGRFAKPSVITASIELQEKVAKIKVFMKEIGNYEQKNAPHTIDEAIVFLKHINMVCSPTDCFEYSNVYFFSGGTSMKKVNDFSSGFAIKKGESKIYTWSASDIAKFDGK